MNTLSTYTLLYCHVPFGCSCSRFRSTEYKTLKRSRYRSIYKFIQNQRLNLDGPSIQFLVHSCRCHFSIKVTEKSLSSTNIAVHYGQEMLLNFDISPEQLGDHSMIRTLHEANRSLLLKQFSQSPMHANCCKIYLEAIFGPWQSLRR